MNRSSLLVYQWVTGLADTFTGVLLYLAPMLTLQMMGVHAPAEAAPYIGYIGAFVLSVGLACLYGARLVRMCGCAHRIETVWLLTAFSRSAVAIYLAERIASGTFEPAWMSVVLFDGACVVVQGVGLHRKWLRYAE